MALEGVAADEQCGALALLQMQDAKRHLEQLVIVDLEQFVAREGLQDIDQRLAIMACRRETGARQDARDLQAQQRNAGR